MTRATRPALAPLAEMATSFLEIHAFALLQVGITLTPQASANSVLQTAQHATAMATPTVSLLASA